MKLELKFISKWRNDVKCGQNCAVTACKLIDTYTRKKKIRNFKFKIRKITDGKKRNVAYVLTEYGKLNTVTTIIN